MDDKIIDIRAKKITQMPDLSNIDWENLYVLLGYNNGTDVANYKVNFLQLAQNLMETGIINPSGNIHYISYSGLNHITSSSPTQFQGRIFTIMLTPELGYKLPNEIEVVGATLVTYNPITGALKIDTGLNDEMISIIGTGVNIEYNLNINIINATFDNITPKSTYHINDEISIQLTTVDQDHYDIPDVANIGLQGLTLINYENTLGYTGLLVFKVNGDSENLIVSGASKRIFNYYFGYSITGDNILNYNENNIPFEPGSRFSFLFKGRNICPINFVQGFDYGNGIDYVPGEYASDNNVYIIVPKDYYVVNGNIFKDDNNIGYKMTAGNSSFERQVQYTEEEDPKLMIYEINYENIEYYILCISTEGIVGHQSFTTIGDISQLLVSIKWDSDGVPYQIAAGQNKTIPLGNVIATYGDGHQVTVSNGFTISYNGTIGTYANNNYIAPSISDMQNEYETITFVCTYQGLTDSKNIIVYVPGIDDNLEFISYDEYLQPIEYNKTCILRKNKVLGNNTDGSTYVIDKPEKLTFTAEYGNIIDNGDGTLTYIAPFRQTDVQETITITYKNIFGTTVRFRVKSPDFHQIIWPTQLPYSIYDTETIELDMTLYKIMDSDNSYEKITTDLNEISVSVSQGTINSRYVFNPSTVASEQFVDIIVTYKHCQTSKRIYVKHGDNTIMPNYFYWYCGQYCPTNLTNPENDMADYNVDPTAPGWRRFTYATVFYKLPTNTNSHSAFNGTIQFYKGYLDSVDYYIVLPKYMYLYDSNGTLIVNKNNPYRQLIIANKEYNVYKMNADSIMNDKIYYDGPEVDYWYVGKDEPSSPISNPELIRPVFGTIDHNEKEVLSGWHTISNLEYLRTNFKNLYSEFDTDEEQQNYSYVTYFDSDNVDYYVVVPVNSRFKDGLNLIQNHDPLRNMIIDEKTYTVYRIYGNVFNEYIYP